MKQREKLSSFHVQRTSAECAKILGISRQCFDNILHKAMKKLRYLILEDCLREGEITEEEFRDKVRNWKLREYKIQRKK